MLKKMQSHQADEVDHLSDKSPPDLLQKLTYRFYLGEEETLN